MLWGLAKAATLTSAGAERFPDLAHTSVVRRGRFPRPLLSYLSKTSLYYRPLFDRQITVQSVTLGFAHITTHRAVTAYRQYGRERSPFVRRMSQFNTKTLSTTLSPGRRPGSVAGHLVIN
jgi:hypothetical protein